MLVFGEVITFEKSRMIWGLTHGETLTADIVPRWARPGPEICDSRTMYEINVIIQCQKVFMKKLKRKGKKGEF